VLSTRQRPSDPSHSLTGRANRRRSPHPPSRGTPGPAARPAIRASLPDGASTEGRGRRNLHRFWVHCPGAMGLKTSRYRSPPPACTSRIPRQGRKPARELGRSLPQTSQIPRTSGPLGSHSAGSLSTIAPPAASNHRVWRPVGAAAVIGSAAPDPAEETLTLNRLHRPYRIPASESLTCAQPGTSEPMQNRHPQAFVQGGRSPAGSSSAADRRVGRCTEELCGAVFFGEAFR
jgi:hypothetical protein